MSTLPYARQHQKDERRRLLLDYCRQAGRTVDEAAEEFGVNYHTMNRWMVELEKNGELARSPITRENGKKVYVTATPDSQMPQVFFATQNGPRPASAFVENYVSSNPALMLIGQNLAGVMAHLYLYAIRKTNEDVEISPTTGETRAELRKLVKYLRDHLNMAEILLTTDVFYHGDKRTLSAFGILEDNLTLSQIIDIATNWEHAYNSTTDLEETLDSDE